MNKVKQEYSLFYEIDSFKTCADRAERDKMSS